jgi:hypothetical protein
MYKEAFEEFVVIEDMQVPEDVQTDWINQLTIKQFNEDLKDVFPYIYKLVSEASTTQDLSFDDIMAEAAPETSMRPQARPEIHSTPALAQRAAEAELGSQPGQMKKQFEKGVDYKIVPAQGGFTYQLAPEVNIGAGSQSTEMPNGSVDGSTRGPAPMESNIDAAYDKLLGQFSDNFNAQVEGEDDTDEGNAYAHAVAKAKMNGQEPGDEIDGPDGKKIKLEKEEQKTPLGEFILSFYDREQGVFPKGETAILTMVEKDYGDRYIKPASKFIERLGQVFEKYQAHKMSTFDLDEQDDISEGFLKNLVGDVRNAFKPGVQVTPNMVKELEAGLAAIKAGGQPTPRQQQTMDTFMSDTLPKELEKMGIQVESSEQAIIKRLAGL